MAAKKFRPLATLKKADMEEKKRSEEVSPQDASSYAYFTNSYLASVDPKAPELANSGIFLCSAAGGTATYLLGGKAFQRTLTPLDPIGGYFQFQESGENALNWFLEIDPNQESGTNVWAVYYQRGKGKRTLFQTATQVNFP